MVVVIMFSSVEQYQQWLRAVMEHICSSPLRLIGERASYAKGHIICMLVRKRRR
jgi:hypothetical protein